jgi:vesicle transport protein SEC22
MAIASDKMVFYYLSRDNLCFLTLCEESYPKRQAFLYLDEIADIIMAELLKEHGTNVRITTSTVLATCTDYMAATPRYAVTKRSQHFTHLSLLFSIMDHHC